MEQIQAEEVESRPSGSGNAEDGDSLHTKDEAYGEAERYRYIGTTGEGAVQATLSTCGGMTAEDKVGNGKAAIADSGVREGVRTRRSGTLCGEASGIEAFTIGEGVATDDDVRMEAATHTASGGAGTFPTPILGTTAVGASARVRPRVTDSGGGKVGDQGGDVGEGAEQATLSSGGKRTAVEKAGDYEADGATSRVGGNFGTRLPEAFYEHVTSILEACEI
jgi:hypothetical protein